MKDNWSLVEVMRHARHDWLNKLQLIKGNLDLNRLDQAKRMIEDIVLESHQEARLSNLLLPGFAELLITFNWDRHSFTLEYEVVEAHGPLRLDDARLTDWCRTFFSAVESVISPIHDNHLYIGIEHGEEGVRFLFQFNGTIEQPEVLRDKIVGGSAIGRDGELEIRELSKTGFEMEMLYKQTRNSR